MHDSSQVSSRLEHWTSILTRHQFRDDLRSHCNRCLGVTEPASKFYVVEVSQHFRSFLSGKPSQFDSISERKFGRKAVWVIVLFETLRLGDLLVKLPHVLQFERL